jgi:flagellar hook-length control protein FliK
MNVEQKSAHAAAHAGGVDSRFAKPKAQGTGNSSSADAGGFMSLLMSLGAGEDPASSILAGQGDALTGGLQPGMDTSIMSSDALPALGTQGTDVAQILQQQGLVPTAGTQGADVAQILQQQGLVPMPGQPGGTMVPGVPQRPDGVPGLGAVGVVPGSSPTGKTAVLGASVEPELPDAGGVPVATKKGVGANKGVNVLAQSAGQDQAQSSTGRQNVAEMLGRGKDFAVGRALEPAASAALAELAAAHAPVGESVRHAARQSDRREGVSMTAEGGWASPAFQVGASMDMSTASASVSGTSPEVAIAEQVQYWISNDVQNAELKLDNWGQSPVEVSISLQGNEARVEFRTDVQELRQVLEGATAQLKDMLQGEGLLLAGVSVGASGTGRGAGGSKEPPPRADVRRATVAVPETAAVARPARTGVAGGRAVDIFV